MCNFQTIEHDSVYVELLQSFRLVFLCALRLNHIIEYSGRHTTVARRLCSVWNQWWKHWISRKAKVIAKPMIKQCDEDNISAPHKYIHQVLNMRPAQLNTTQLNLSLSIFLSFYCSHRKRIAFVSCNDCKLLAFYLIKTKWTKIEIKRGKKLWESKGKWSNNENEKKKFYNYVKSEATFSIDSQYILSSSVHFM